MEKLNSFLIGCSGFLAVTFVDIIPIGNILNGVASMVIAGVTVYKLLYDNKKEPKK